MGAAPQDISIDVWAGECPPRRLDAARQATSALVCALVSAGHYRERIEHLPANIVMPAAGSLVRVERRRWRADVVVRLDRDEHGRRSDLGLREVGNRALLNVLMGLPEGHGVDVDALDVSDQQLVWSAPAGVVDVVDGRFVRRLRRPMAVEIAYIAAKSWRTAQPAVREFAAHCARFVALPDSKLDPIVRLEAEHLGVGLASSSGEIILAPRTFVQRRFTAVGWQFQENLYGQMLGEGCLEMQGPLVPQAPSTLAR
jgi:hypothetical protein